MTLPTLRLAKNEERRLRGGHLWIYSNEVDKQASPLKSFQAGEQVVVESSQGKTLGVAYINPQSLICARLLSGGQQPFGQAMIEQRIAQALAVKLQLVMTIKPHNGSKKTRVPMLSTQARVRGLKR